MFLRKEIFKKKAKKIFGRKVLNRASRAGFLIYFLLVFSFLWAFLPYVSVYIKNSPGSSVIFKDPPLVKASSENATKLVSARLLNAEGLDVAEVLESVKNQDNVWTQAVPGEYLSLSFEKELDSNSDITLYARPSRQGSAASIEIYAKGSKKAAAKILNIDHEGLYKVLLRGLTSPARDFELRFKNSAVDIDFVIDPAYTVLHSFDSGAKYGKNPYAGPVVSGSKIYGTTFDGGAAGYGGTVYSVNTDGSNFALLHSFNVDPGDGNSPDGGVIVSGSKLYGMASYGGEFGTGIIYALNTDGTGYEILHSFADTGGLPTGSLVLSGSTLYGMTQQGGDYGYGVIFSINTDGTGYTVMHNFGGSDVGDGSGAQGELLLAGSVLYGMTFGGGDNGAGVIFSINTDGSGYTIIHQFTFAPDDAASPAGGLVISGSVLYGMSVAGGTDDLGTVFSIETNGSNFTLLHSFAAGESSYPYGSFILSGSVLYGAVGGADPADFGIVFSMNTDGSGFNVLHRFGGGLTDGAFFYGTLALSSSTLFGVTNNGGTTNNGTIFSIGTDGQNYSILHMFSENAWNGQHPSGPLVVSGSKVYGTTIDGGQGCGTIFSMNTDGTGVTYLKQFDSQSTSPGCYPQSGVVLSGGKLYGTTSHGGTRGQGNVFSVNPDGSSFSTLLSFNYNTSGGNPYSSLVVSGTKIYGIGDFAGFSGSGLGTIYSMNTDGTGFSVLHNFTFASSALGASPRYGLTLSGSKLYGVTAAGGSSGKGVIFSMNTDGSGYTVLKSFVGGSGDGDYPISPLLLSASKLYGVTHNGGATDNGVIYSINTDGSGFAIVHSFTWPVETSGAYPPNPLILSNSKLIGMTYGGGTGSAGTIFYLNTDGTGFTVLREFSESDGGGFQPQSGVVLSGGLLYGSALYGGAGGLSDGVVFSQTAPDIVAPSVAAFSPADNSTGADSSGNLVITFDEPVVAAAGNITIKKSSDNTTVETVDVASGKVTGSGTDTITINPATDLSSLTGYYVQIDSGAFADLTENSYAGISDSTSWNFTTAAVVLTVSSAQVSTTASSSVTVTWNTNTGASSKLEYGFTSGYGSLTSETDISPRVTSHSVTLSGLLSCTTYHIRAVSLDASLAQATSSDITTTTTGCTVPSTVVARAETQVATSSGGSLELPVSSGSLVLGIPANFATTSAAFQAKQLDEDSVIPVISKPSGASLLAGSNIFQLSALASATSTVSTFLQPLTITVSYSDSDVSGINESSLVIYRWDESTGWAALENCAVNTAANTISCTTQHFSIFGLFGSQAASSGGGGLPASVYMLPVSPSGGFAVKINKGEPVTVSRNVVLSFTAGPDVKRLAVSSRPDFSDAGQQDFQSSISWDLCANVSCAPGKYTVYVKFYTAWGQSSQAVSASINYEPGAKNGGSSSGSAASPGGTNSLVIGLTRDLKSGNTGPDVKLLQRFLNSQGFTVAKSGPGSPGLETEKFGAATRAALISFQKAHIKELKTAPGVVGPATRALINALLAKTF